MKISQYIEKKKFDLEALKTMGRQRCFKCMKPQRACLCSNITPFDTNTRFIILMHPKEAKKERVGTGHISHRCLNNSKIFVGESFDNHAEVQELLKSTNYQFFLLYPGKEAHNLDHGLHATWKDNGLIKVVFVIDGTWSCAKSMMRDSRCLHNLPRISFDCKKISQFLIKLQPSPQCLSTIESIYHVLNCLEKFGAEHLKKKQENLIYVLDKLCQFQIECANAPQANRYRPGRFKNKEIIKPSKKWLERNIFFD